jgi:hypothetical protein
MQNKKSSLISTIMIILIITALIPGLAACSSTVSASAARIDFMAENSADNPGQTAGSQFQVDNSYVIRCITSVESEQGVNITATKNKSAKVISLIFVNIDEAKQANSTVVKMATVPLKGAEGDYDISQASYRNITMTAAQNLVDSYGVTYDNWQNGLSSNGEKFPCCQ